VGRIVAVIVGVGAAGLFSATISCGASGAVIDTWLSSAASFASSSAGILTRIVAASGSMRDGSMRVIALSDVDASSSAGTRCFGAGGRNTVTPMRGVGGGVGRFERG
jgi:hypothetical protein